ncbi:MAG TPA: hypothetical protein VNQ32_09785 [Steroidobacteraceae bacterium]|nr:hypothetical protein [Steroidobacteraceae bacterium]
MSASWRARLCLLALLPLLSLRAAEAPPPAAGEPAAGQADRPAPAPPPIEATQRPAPPPPAQEEEEPPLEPISADNNLTFPVDI